MAMRDIGVSRAYQCALIDTMDELIAAPGVAPEVARRAQWLKWGLEGREPGTEPLEFIADAPPLVPLDQGTPSIATAAGCSKQTGLSRARSATFGGP